MNKPKAPLQYNAKGQLLCRLHNRPIRPCNIKNGNKTSGCVACYRIRQQRHRQTEQRKLQDADYQRKHRKTPQGRAAVARWNQSEGAKKARAWYEERKLHG